MTHAERAHSRASDEADEALNALCAHPQRQRQRPDHVHHQHVCAPRQDSQYRASGLRASSDDTSDEEPCGWHEIRRVYNQLRRFWNRPSLLWTPLNQLSTEDDYTDYCSLSRRQRLFYGSPPPDARYGGNHNRRSSRPQIGDTSWPNGWANRSRTESSSDRHEAEHRRATDSEDFTLPVLNRADALDDLSQLKWFAANPRRHAGSPPQSRECKGFSSKNGPIHIRPPQRVHLVDPQGYPQDYARYKDESGLCITHPIEPQRSRGKPQSPSEDKCTLQEGPLDNFESTHNHQGFPRDYMNNLPDLERDTNGFARQAHKRPCGHEEQTRRPDEYVRNSHSHDAYAMHQPVHDPCSTILHGHAPNLEDHVPHPHECTTDHLADHRHTFIPKMCADVPPEHASNRHEVAFDPHEHICQAQDYAGHVHEHVYYPKEHALDFHELVHHSPDYADCPHDWPPANATCLQQYNNICPQGHYVAEPAYWPQAQTWAPPVCTCHLQNCVGHFHQYPAQAIPYNPQGCFAVLPQVNVYNNPHGSLLHSTNPSRCPPAHTPFPQDRGSSNGHFQACSCSLPPDAIISRDHPNSPSSNTTTTTTNIGPSAATAGHNTPASSHAPAHTEHNHLPQTHLHVADAHINERRDHDAQIMHKSPYVHATQCNPLVGTPAGCYQVSQPGGTTIVCGGHSRHDDCGVYLHPSQPVAGHHPSSVYVASPSSSCCCGCWGSQHSYTPPQRGYTGEDYSYYSFGVPPSPSSNGQGSESVPTSGRPPAGGPQEVASLFLAPPPVEACLPGQALYGFLTYQEPLRLA